MPFSIRQTSYGSCCHVICCSWWFPDREFWAFAPEKHAVLLRKCYKDHSRPHMVLGDDTPRQSKNARNATNTTRLLTTRLLKFLEAVFLSSRRDLRVLTDICIQWKAEYNFQLNMCSWRASLKPASESRYSTLASTNLQKGDTPFDFVRKFIDAGSCHIQAVSQPPSKTWRSKRTGMSPTENYPWKFMLPGARRKCWVLRLLY